MTMFKIGPEIDSGYPESMPTSWSKDYGPRGAVVRDRPCACAPPSLRRAGDPGSRWGTPPGGEFGSGLPEETKQTWALIPRAWSWLRNVIRGGASPPDSR